MKTTMGSEVKKGDVVVCGDRANLLHNYAPMFFLSESDDGYYVMPSLASECAGEKNICYTPEEYKELLNKPERFDLCFVRDEESRFPLLRFCAGEKGFYRPSGSEASRWNFSEKIPLEDWIENPLFAWAKEVRETLIKQYGGE